MFYQIYQRPAVSIFVSNHPKISRVSWDYLFLPGEENMILEIHKPNDLKAIPTMLAIWALRSPAGRMSHVASYDRRPRRSSTSGFGAI
jgi:hypothetical protein